jgi:LCP family protein required for cell wall assembly
MVTTKVSQVTGLPTNRWITIDFQGFRTLVDAMGGVDIDVERAFSAQYPANDDPAIDPNWITVSFAAGRQHMDGETAIRYARARYADTSEEASDFARSQRQNRLVAAIAAKLKRPTVWPRAFAIMDALQPALRTNLAPVDLPILFLRANLAGATHIRLDDSNVLVNDTSSDGQAILVPRNDDYGAIARYITEQIPAR